MVQWAGKLIDEIFGEKCEGQLIQPTFITDYPIEMSIIKNIESVKGLVERFEAVVMEKEICNSFFTDLMIRLTKEKDLKNNWS